MAIGRLASMLLNQELVEQLRSENAFLRSQLQTREQAHSEALQRRDEEIMRVHVLLQQEQQQVKTLTDQREQPRWLWLRRLLGR